MALANMSDYVLKDPVTEEDVNACGGFSEEFFTKLHQKFGKNAEFSIFGARHISMADPDDIRMAHDKLLIRPPVVSLVLSFLGPQNLLFQQKIGDVRQIREMYREVIHSPGLLRLVQDSTIDVLGKAFEEWSHKPSVNLSEELAWNIYDIMGRVMFGGEWSTQAVGREIYSIHMYLVENSERWGFLPPEQKDEEPEYKTYLAKIQEFRGICARLLDEKAAQDAPDRERYDAFALILTAKRADGKPFFDREYAITSVIGFLHGAFDTTNTTLQWVLFHLARFPKVQEQLRQKILAAGDSGDAGMAALAHSIPYLENFVKETQRCKPTTPYNIRVNPDHDVTINGVSIPKETPVMLPYFISFNDPAFFGPGADDPYGFDPSRYEGDTEVVKQRIAYHTPFGGGERMCVGFPVAKVEIKVALVMLLRFARVSLAEDIPLPMPTTMHSGTLQPGTPIKIRLEKLSVGQSRM